ncbi:hypothetical protein EQ500_00570 [Lactobacillus sp. XV13L]|nr:hypothetical protein [Lactobacillus sp. XV13L]
MKKTAKIGLTILAIGIVLVGLGTVAMHFWAGKTDPNARQVQLAPFTQIDSDTAAYSVNVRTGASYHATVSGKYKEEVTVRVANHGLVIREAKHHPGHFFFNYDPVITVTVPRTARLKQATITAAAGRATLSHVVLENLDLDLEAGSASLTDVTVRDKAKAVLKAGSLKIADSALKLNAQVAAGSTKIDRTKLHGASRINLDAGSLTMTATPLSGYDFSTTVGTISYHGQNRGRHFSHGTSTKNTLTAKAAVGAIKVN